VVKNVAGFDLVRLNVGAWGTLGIITEATVRLRALPTIEATIAVALAGDIDGLTNQLQALRSAQLAPLAMEMLNTVLASNLDIATADVVLVRVAGNEETVRSQREVLESLGDTCEVPHDVWNRLQRSDPEESASVRTSRRPSELATLWHAAKTACASLMDVQMHANVERGIVRVVVPQGMSAELQPLVSDLANVGTVIAERLPVACWGSLGVDFASPLAVNARRAFDPGAILNRGVLAPHA
jgi:glycolate oxidase FAD binding subunit